MYSDFAIQMASLYGYKEVVQLLLKHPLVDPSSQRNSATKELLTFFCKIRVWIPQIEPMKPYGLLVLAGSDHSNLAILGLVDMDTKKSLIFFVKILV
jgi:hypothetical protein